jgi:hypothetical protein
MMLKLAGWKLEAGDRTGAGRAADMVRELLIDAPALADSLTEPLDTLRSKLGAS